MIEIVGVTGIGEVTAGDDVAALIIEALTAEAGDPTLRDGDIVVVTHKIVSKAEGMVAAALDDAAYRALVLDEAATVIRRRGDLVITETEHGFVCANAGVDRSNAPEGQAILLPRDPDASAQAIRTRLQRATGLELGVIVSDTFGRAWRRGVVDVALGIAGVTAILDLRGTPDAGGRVMEATEIAIADEIAAAADLVMGKATSVPVAVVRGAGSLGSGTGKDLVRPPSEDLFR